MKKLNSEVYKVDEVTDFRELVNRSTEKYSDNIAYKFKINLNKPNEKVIEKISNDDKLQHKIKDLFAHKVKIEKDSILYDIVQNEEFLVNSRHRCNVIKTNKFDIVRTIRRWSY